MAQLPVVDALSASRVQVVPDILPQIRRSLLGGRRVVDAGRAEHIHVQLEGAPFPRAQLQVGAVIVVVQEASVGHRGQGANSAIEGHEPMVHRPDHVLQADSQLQQLRAQ
eukprot:13125295-Heterocapsa_arctica.AAC.3